MKSPNACKARGLSDGRIYTRQGKLVASVAQEGLIRNWIMKK
jgi:acyl-CoA thioesterase-2